MVPDTIGTFLTETWITSDVIDSEIDIPGCIVFHSDRNWCTHGDVAFYLKSDLGGVMAHSFSNGVIETLTVKCKSIKTISVTIYSPPNSCCNLREWSDGCKVPYQGLFKQEELFSKFMSDKFLSNHVNRSTMLNNLLDLICSNVPEWFG